MLSVYNRECCFTAGNWGGNLLYSIPEPHFLTVLKQNSSKKIKSCNCSYIMKVTELEKSHGFFSEWSVLEGKISEAEKLSLAPREFFKLSPMTA